MRITFSRSLRSLPISGHRASLKPPGRDEPSNGLWLDNGINLCPTDANNSPWFSSWATLGFVAVDQDFSACRRTPSDKVLHTDLTSSLGLEQ